MIHVNLTLYLSNLTYDIYQSHMVLNTSYIKFRHYNDNL